MRINVDSFIRSQLKMRLKRLKAGLVKKQKLVAALEKEYAKYQKRAKKR